MTAADVVALAESRGVRLTIRGDRLGVAGPRSAIENLRATLSLRKLDVLAYLAERASVPTATDAVAAASDLLRKCQ